MTSGSDTLAIGTAPLGGSPLSRALQARATPPEWRVAVPPTGTDAWSARVRDVVSTRNGGAGTSGAPTDWWPALAPAFGNNNSPAAERLAEAARAGAVVTTGQQPGLFGGPAYSLTKAISALAYADALSEQLGMPIAPVFWAATDDADWEEAAAVHVVGRDGLERLSLTGPATHGVPLAHVPLGNVQAALHALSRACGSNVDARVLDAVSACYDSGTTIGSSYVAFMRAVLEPLGISVLDASHPAITAAAFPLLQQALRGAHDIDHALHQQTASIVAAGFAPQVDLVDGLSLVFQTHDGVRQRVPLADAARVAADAHVGSLGGNVLLRPVIERALLPTVAYVAGPGELAYFAQVPAVAHALGVAAPLAVPRWSASWREPATTRVMERLGITSEDLAEPEALATRLARSAMDQDVADSLERLRAVLEAQLGALGEAVAADDSLLPPVVVAGATRQLVHKLDRLERRLVAAVKRREHELTRDLALVQAAVAPLGGSPERVLSLVPLLVRHGLGVLERMRGIAHDHAVRVLNGAATQAP